MNLRNTFQNKQFEFHFTELSQSQHDKTVTPNKTSFFEERIHKQNETKKTQRICSRCQKLEVKKYCQECKCLELCGSCDKIIHGVGKFLNHNRIQINPLKSIFCNILQQKSNTSIEIEERNKENIEDTSFALLNIKQTWNKILSQISTKFQQLIDQLQDKRKLTLQKFEHKKQQEIQNYKSLIKEFSTFLIQTKNVNENSYKQRKQSKCITQDIQVKIKRIQTDYMQQQIQKKHKVFYLQLRNIENEICKIDFKNIISKICDDNTKPINKSMRSPQMIQSCTSIGTSPNTKTPITLKSHLSQSTLDIDSSDKMPQKHKHTLKISYNEKQMKMLTRVRSEKLFCKSPTNLQKQIKQKTFILQK